MGTARRPEFEPVAGGGLLHRRIFLEFSARALADNAAGFDQIAAVGDFEALLRILLDRILRVLPGNAQDLLVLRRLGRPKPEPQTRFEHLELRRFRSHRQQHLRRTRKPRPARLRFGADSARSGCSVSFVTSPAHTKSHSAGSTSSTLAAPRSDAHAACSCTKKLKQSPSAAAASRSLRR